MGNLESSVIEILQFLLPGFVTAWVFYALTSYAKQSEFERVVQALIFTLFVQAVTYLAESLFLLIGHYKSFGIWNSDKRHLTSLIVALTLGLLFTYLANSDKLHKCLRFLKITKDTSYPSEWFSAFSKQITFVVLHFKDERRLMGWPIEWPSQPDSGHFLLIHYSWITDPTQEIVGIQSKVESILIDAKDVRWVEFMSEASWKHSENIDEKAI
ncbi:MAG: hypothetical protein KKF22_09700 [Gammaproteobacteria bacterium]|nr:hypothetical protein [Gammaproteobacteria bacterium]